MREDAGVTDEDAPGGTPLVDEAMKKAAVAWVSVAGGPALALWCAPLEGALLVVSGPGEQAAPGLADATEAQVTLRGDHGGRIVTWPARVSRLQPGTEAWDVTAPLVAAKRLNAPGPTADLVARWAADGCAVNRLAPAGTPLAGAELPADAQAEPPRATPAVRATRKPFRLHRVRRR
ncbi:hypothetical protein [Micromonospora saelicesensis]|jgi:hypothetical protein|uniref:Uncharacterized protein n=1 Tax=Micromonospora saelicesensis TaxID=285676 RepID=A0A1C4UH10_9ACTN|nr:hypothetical protein [Micromonospora saelicesensis]RAO38371.1 hypothetical protein PSN13_00837 [Micromonospora saelicesensis]RAO40543.1 hypothetical protein GAR06_06289 [Micromonospora saelicesensis]RAO41577.1 hypothetical protein PSN01_06523 [Micromonospora saelicesensis]RAO58466.1 hypothetical protein LUPAC06_02696 [Micromonospora saelicesensis]SCE70960.1 hypothetical protein GA0070561_1028 [Micromonospora saelicesensis]